MSDAYGDRAIAIVAEFTHSTGPGIETERPTVAVFGEIHDLVALY